jgi:hypothetical protein
MFYLSLASQILSEINIHTIAMKLSITTHNSLSSFSYRVGAHVGKKFLELS